SPARLHSARPSDDSRQRGGCKFSHRHRKRCFAPAFPQHFSCRRFAPRSRKREKRRTQRPPAKEAALSSSRNEKEYFRALSSGVEGGRTISLARKQARI